MEELGLVDIYRKLHLNIKAFTHGSTFLKLKSRIEFFLISNMIALNVKKAEIRSSIAPDHKTIFLSQEVNTEFRRGPGSWKFDNQLLEDDDYVNLITFSCPGILAKYIDFSSKTLLWEMITMEIRSKTIAYSKKKRNDDENKEITIQNEIQELDYKICNDSDLGQNTLNRY